VYRKLGFRAHEELALSFCCGSGIEFLHCFPLTVSVREGLDQLVYVLASQVLFTIGQLRLDRFLKLLLVLLIKQP
jgi:hypothetical protein